MASPSPHLEPSSPAREIIIRGARQNNLKDLTLRIPQERFVVVTGPSGSGKSSLAFETLYMEGQRRYIESLSTYARQFFDRVTKPDVDGIDNICPSVALEQKNPIRHSRSTVGTSTEIYDYLRLLFSKIGQTICPSCGRQVTQDTAQSTLRQLLAEFSGRRGSILFRPEPTAGNDLKRELLERGYVRVMIDQTIVRLEEFNPTESDWKLKGLYVVVDRLEFSEENRSRILEALQTCFREGSGAAYIQLADSTPLDMMTFSQKFRCEECRREFIRPTPFLFSFNSAFGACPQCNGFGNKLQYDTKLIIQNPALSLLEGAVEPWTKPSLRVWNQRLIKYCRTNGIPVDRPFRDLSEKDQSVVIRGAKGFPGVIGFFEQAESKKYKLHVRVFLRRYQSTVACPSCHGARLRSEALVVRIAGKNIAEVCGLSVGSTLRWVESLSLTPFEEAVTREIRKQLLSRLTILERVGLDYLSLDRQSKTLSGGESQRIALGNQLGSQLTGTLYVLDEPSVGLHARDRDRLIAILKELVEIGNSLVVVEHDIDLISAADHVIEMGPGSGEAGGRIMFEGSMARFRSKGNTATAEYLRGERRIHVPSVRRQPGARRLVIEGASENNLKQVDAEIPLGLLVCVSGVSGSGKSTLIKTTLYQALARMFGIEYEAEIGRFQKLTGMEYLSGVSLLDQKPIGKTLRSNPVTYIKAFDDIRKIFSDLPKAKRLGLEMRDFSFNVDGGRCDRCKGEGSIHMDMYFMTDLFLTCEECEGKRFKKKILNQKYRGKSIFDVLNMTAAEAKEFFSDYPKLSDRLGWLVEVGLGHLRLGQPAPTLSGGEAQRLKIATELSRPERRQILYILDEPTTGLHLDEIAKLLQILNRLVDEGNTVIVIEHHGDVIRASDWVIDLGPEGGERGGEIVAAGPPELIAETPRSHTGNYLRMNQ